MAVGEEVIIAKAGRGEVGGYPFGAGHDSSWVQPKGSSWFRGDFNDPLPKEIEDVF